MYMDVCAAMSSNTRHLVMVIEPFAQVRRFTNVDGSPSTLARLFGEDVVARHVLELCAYLVDLVVVAAARCPGPLDVAFR